MQVGIARLVGRAFVRAGLVAAVLAATLITAPASAQAITQAEIIARSKKWVAKKVAYSQRGHYRGYRRDCSGFVSMAWGLKRSYTSRTLSSRATRIPISKLQPGDAVWIPGHVSIFGGWKNKSKRQYYALEQTTWGSHAKRRVRTIPSRAKALRRKGLKAPLKVAVAPKAAPVVPTPGALASIEIREALAGSPATFTVAATLAEAVSESR